MTELKDVTDAEYARLVEDSRFLECLRAMGVDNWDYYGDAWQMYHEQYGDDDETD